MGVVSSAAGKLGSFLESGAFNAVKNAAPGGSFLGDINLGESLQSFGGNPNGKFVLVPKAYASEGSGQEMPSYMRDASIPLDMSKFPQDTTKKDTPTNDGSFDKFDKNANPGDGWGWHGSDGGWKPEGGGSGGGGVDTRALEDAYGRLQGLFGEQETTARGTAASADKSILDNYGSSIAKTEAEKAKMLRDIQLNKQRFDEAGFGALDQNARDYSALEQRANVRYGGGSGVGDLMRELAAKEFYRSQGGVRKQQLAGEQDFANQMSDTELFIGEKLGDLDLWKNDAMAEVKNRLTTQLNQISSMRAESEIAKEERKLAALQTAQENARRITEADNQFKSNLLTQYMASKSEIMGRALTPQEIQSIIPQFMGPGLNPSGSTEAGPAFRTFGNEEDELTALNAVNQQLPA